VKILIVDDDSEFREIARLSLSKNGYDMLEASGGREAIDLARKVQPALILLDILMPGLDGYETCRQLKTNPATSHIPIIILTALADPLASYKARQAGADDCIAKPVTSQELRDRVERDLRRYELFHGARQRAKENE
jgi:DNA-binding response OmpR family regulator